jgi:hypothetical protein
MEAYESSMGRRFRWLTLALLLLFALSCTSFATHVDKAGGDDGKGHCSICLGGTAHIVQPVAALAISPQLVAAGITTPSDPAVKQDQFASSLYIRPPPSR